MAALPHNDHSLARDRIDVPAFAGGDATPLPRRLTK